jgi:hypothetical protein
MMDGDGDVVESTFARTDDDDEVDVMRDDTDGLTESNQYTHIETCNDMNR